MRFLILFCLTLPITTMGQSFKDLYICSDYKEAHFYYKRKIIDEYIARDFENPPGTYTYNIGIGMPLNKKCNAELFTYKEDYWIGFRLKSPNFFAVGHTVETARHIGLRTSYNMVNKSIFKLPVHLDLGIGYIYARGTLWKGFLDGNENYFLQAELPVSATVKVVSGETAGFRKNFNLLENRVKFAISPKKYLDIYGGYGLTLGLNKMGYMTADFKLSSGYKGQVENVSHGTNSYWFLGVKLSPMQVFTK